MDASVTSTEAGRRLVRHSQAGPANPKERKVVKTAKPAKNFTKSSDPERLKVRDEIYHYWGTAWVAIGLLETLGKSGS